jgi:DNA-binding MarR family transcriptional regulator
VPVDHVRRGALAAYVTLIEVGRLLQQAVEQRWRDEGGGTGESAGRSTDRSTGRSTGASTAAVTYVQFQILVLLDDAPDRRMRITDIADRLVYSRSALTYQSKQLAEADLVTRTPSSTDERSTILALTRRGEAVLDRFRPGHDDVVHRTLRYPLSHHETVALGGLLGRVRDHIRDDRVARRPRPWV